MQSDMFMLAMFDTMFEMFKHSETAAARHMSLFQNFCKRLKCIEAAVSELHMFLVNFSLMLRGQGGLCSKNLLF